MRHLMTSRGRREERGAAAVEFALVLPLLLTLLFGITAYGFIFAESLSLGNAARQMARAGVIDGATCGQLIDMLTDPDPDKRIADTIGMKGADVAYSITRGTSAGGSSACGGDELCKGQGDGTNIYVTLTFETEKSGVEFPFVPIPKEIKQTGTFRCEL